jgi:NADPH:quinone reductase-like Zn-dependent oxidoreductase
VYGEAPGAFAEYVAALRTLGADEIVDYPQDDFTRRQYDVVLDLVGNRSLADLRRALRYVETEHARAKVILTA